MGLLILRDGEEGFVGYCWEDESSFLNITIPNVNAPRSSDCVKSLR